MRPHFIKTTIALFLCSPFAATGAQAAEWNGSYSVNGQCFCVGAVASDVENTIVPTPIGGQTVAQVCQRIGAGPELTLSNGLYNYPVYTDSQCGHGPFEAGSAAAVSSCAGSLDGKGAESTSCQPAGAKWDIKRAFSKQTVSEEPKIVAAANEKVESVVKKQASTSNTKTNSTGLMNKPVVTSISVKRADEVDGTTRTLKATVISSASTAGRKLPKREALEPFTGKIITIGGKRYMQARDDLPAKGGEPGSRIVLDGSVFLLDDGTINATDLHRGKPTTPKKKKKTSSNKTNNVAKQRLVDNRRDETVSDLPRQTSQRLVVPQREVQPDRSDRNSVPRTLPAPSENNSQFGTTTISSLDRANAKDEITSRNNTQTSDVLIIPSQPVTDLATIREEELFLSDSTSIIEPQLSEIKTAQPLETVTRVEESTTTQIATVTEDITTVQGEESINQVGSLSALRLPASIRNDNARFSYVEAMPVSYDVGGAGLVVKGSTESHSKFHYVGRVGVTNSYQEAMIGGGYYVTPRSADRLTMVLQAGIEYGSFSLDDDQDPTIAVNYSDTGLYFGAGTRLVLNHRFELRGGLGYSSFFQGDLLMFGGAFWHLTPQLDLISQFELGDNDLVGLGIRFYY